MSTTETPDLIAALESVSADAIRQRLQELRGSEKALRVLLRAAIRREAETRRRQPIPAGGKAVPS